VGVGVGVCVGVGVFVGVDVFVTQTPPTQVPEHGNVPCTVMPHPCEHVVHTDTVEGQYVVFLVQQVPEIQLPEQQSELPPQLQELPSGIHTVPSHVGLSGTSQLPKQ